MPTQGVPTYLKIKSKDTGITWISPSYDPKLLPAEAAKILKESYAAIRDEQYKKNKANKESKAMKQKAASLAWNNVSKAGYKKDKSRKWSKVQAFHHSVMCFRQITLTENEILDRISYSEVERIKKNDPHPYFRAYDLAQEGEYSPKILGEDPKSTKWPKKAIQSIKNLVLKGIKFFKGHNEDNSTENRKPLGEIVADYQTEIDGETHHIIIGYFPEKGAVVDGDIISMEADVTFFDYAGKWIADKIDSITGIALGSTKNGEYPAFTGSHMLGAVQALEKEISMPDEKMNFYKLKEYVKEFNVFPHQLFSVDELKQDREFGKFFIEFETKEKKYTEDLKAIEDRAKTAEEKLKTIETDYNKNTALIRMENYLKANNIILTPTEKKFIDSIFKTETDFSDEGIKKFVDKSKALYKEMAVSGVFGEKEKPVEQTQTASGTGNIDYTSPEFNEAITPD